MTQDLLARKTLVGLALFFFAFLLHPLPAVAIKKKPVERNACSEVLKNHARKKSYDRAGFGLLKILQVLDRLVDLGVPLAQKSIRAISADVLHEASRDLFHPSLKITANDLADAAQDILLDIYEALKSEGFSKPFDRVKNPKRLALTMQKLKIAVRVLHGSTPLDAGPNTLKADSEETGLLLKLVLGQRPGHGSVYKALKKHYPEWNVFLRTIGISTAETIEESAEIEWTQSKIIKLLKACVRNGISINALDLMTENSEAFRRISARVLGQPVTGGAFVAAIPRLFLNHEDAVEKAGFDPNAIRSEENWNTEKHMEILDEMDWLGYPAKRKALLELDNEGSFEELSTSVIGHPITGASYYPRALNFFGGIDKLASVAKDLAKRRRERFLASGVAIESPWGGLAQIEGQGLLRLYKLFEFIFTDKKQVSAPMIQDLVQRCPWAFRHLEPLDIEDISYFLEHGNVSFKDPNAVLPVLAPSVLIGYAANRLELLPRSSLVIFINDLLEISSKNPQVFKYFRISRFVNLAKALTALLPPRLIPKLILKDLRPFVNSYAEDITAVLDGIRPHFRNPDDFSRYVVLQFPEIASTCKSNDKKSAIEKLLREFPAYKGDR